MNLSTSDHLFSFSAFRAHLSRLFEKHGRTCTRANLYLHSNVSTMLPSIGIKNKTKDIKKVLPFIWHRYLVVNCYVNSLFLALECKLYFYERIIVFSFSFIVFFFSFSLSLSLSLMFWPINGFRMAQLATEAIVKNKYMKSLTRLIKTMKSSRSSPIRRKD